jgi:hypothetical protein
MKAEGKLSRVDILLNLISVNRLRAPSNQPWTANSQGHGQSQGEYGRIRNLEKPNMTHHRRAAMRYPSSPQPNAYITAACYWMQLR